MIERACNLLRTRIADPALWQLRHLRPVGSRRGFAPSGRWLARSDLPHHPEFHYTPIYPEERIAFVPLVLPPDEISAVERAEKEDDWANEIRAGFVACLGSGRLAQGENLLTPADNFYTELRFPHTTFSSLRDLYTLRHPRYGRPRKLRGRALVLFSTGNFYMFLFETVARIAMAEQAGQPMKSFDWFVSDAPTTRSEREILALLGVDPERFVVAEGKTPHLAFDEVVFSNTTYGIPFALCTLLRSALQGLEPKVPAFGLPKKIYLSRGKKYATRRTVNEDDVQALVRRFGFEVFLPHEHTLSEQRAVFAGADAIVSSHGAALANLLWCRPGTTVIEMRNARHVRGYWKVYWNLGSALALKYHWINCAPSNCDDNEGSGQYSDFIVPLARLEELLAQMGQMS